MNNLIFSISVTFNPDIHLLDRQINSLGFQVECIIIIDNGSSNLDELVPYLENKKNQSGQRIIAVYNGKNRGLGYAQNIGIKKAFENGANDILLLDQDSVLTENFIQELLDTRDLLTKQNIRVGAIGPVYYSESTNEIYPITKFWGPFIKRIEPSSKPEEASFLIASGCFINNKVIEDIGLMNEDLFIDCIDVDWSFRAQEKGYKLYVSPKAKMMHIIGEKRINIAGRSIAVHSPLRRYYLFRNSIFMVRSRYIPIGYKLREITFNAFRLLVYLSLSKDRLRYLKYSLTGFKDGLKGIGGECIHRF
jgi:rhamnosyltransferase